MLMHDRHDDNLPRLLSEQDAEGERFGETPADIKFDGWVQAGIQNDAIDGILHRCQKSSPEIRLLLLVVFRRRDHFGFGIGMELDDLHVSEA